MGLTFMGQIPGQPELWESRGYPKSQENFEQILTLNLWWIVKLFIHGLNYHLHKELKGVVVAVAVAVVVVVLITEKYKYQQDQLTNVATE